MIINSSHLRAAGFKLDKVISPQLEAAARSRMRKNSGGDAFRTPSKSLVAG